MSVFNWENNSLKQNILQAFASFSPRQKLWLGIVASVFIITGISAFYMFNDRYLVRTVAVEGGSLSEGVIGVSGFVNPLLAVSDADHDLSTLIYSGLLRVDDAGQLIPDLAEKYEVSKDKLVYTFTLKKNLTWQDGAPLTVNDIAFTIARAQDEKTRSPKRASWEGVKVATTSDDKIIFSLKKPYANFLENTTLGILPKHIWEKVDSQSTYLDRHNLESIGSGPYKIAGIKKDSDGIPQHYDLESFGGFALGKAKIKSLRFRFYSNAENLLSAFHSGEIESIGSIDPIIAQTLEKQGVAIQKILSPRVFAVFFNQNQSPIFAQAEVRQALNMATDRRALVLSVLKGYGLPIDSPMVDDSIEASTLSVKPEGDIAAAAKLLDSKGWKKGSDGLLSKKIGKKTETLSFTITTANAPELKQAAMALAKNWEILGIRVNISVFELSDLNQNVIKPRKFDALLFGEVLGRNADLYAFWHSSQRAYPGINIAQYANTKADKLLEALRQEDDPILREKTVEQIAKIFGNDLPAIFLYTPNYLYILPPKIKGEQFPPINTPAERLSSIYKWYMSTEKIWKIFPSSPY